MVDADGHDHVHCVIPLFDGVIFGEGGRERICDLRYEKQY